MSDFNLSDKEVEKLISHAQKKSGIDIGKMKSAAEKGKLEDFIGQNVSLETGKKIKQVLSDKEAVKKMLGSKEAQDLLKKFMKE